MNKLSEHNFRACPLSYAQQRLWFLSELAPGSTFYNAPGQIVIRGELSVCALEQSLREVVRRHEALRTRFVVGAEGPMQVVIESIGVELEIADLRGVEGVEATAHAVGEQESRRSFDLTEGPLVRARLLWKGEGEYVLLLTLHHIVSDGWSQQILVRELTELYESFAVGEPSRLEELGIQYGDYAEWQRGWLQGAVYREQLAYWKGQLEGMETLQLPADRARPAIQSFRGGVEQSVVASEVLAGLRALARREGVTLYMVLLAGYVALLHRYSGQGDVVLGTPIANRNRPEIEGLIGFFVNTLVLRVKVRERMSFRELVREVRAVCLGAYANQDLPFEKLVDELQPERDLSRNPLFQVMFVMMNTPDQHLRLGQAEVEVKIVKNESSKFDLQMFASESGGSLQLLAEYSRDLYEGETVGRMVRHYSRLLESAVAEPERSVDELEMLGAAERRQLLEEWNDTASDYEADVCLQELIERQVKLHPDAIAVVSGEESISYEELNVRANQLAHALRARGVGAEQVVGICLERSVELMVGLLGILKAGGAYLPLDSEYPAERLRWMIEDAGAKLVLTRPGTEGALGRSGAELLFWDEALTEKLRDRPSSNPESITGGENLVYVIFTSGSTGRPKGAMNRHRGVCNRLLWMQSQYGLDATDRVLQKTPSSFDVSGWEFFWPLIAGACVEMAAPWSHHDPSYLVRSIQEREVTTVHFVPSMFEYFLMEDGVRGCSSLRRVICSGEALTPELVRRHHELLGAELHNLYGPTEASIDVSFWKCEADWEEASVPIGRPIANTQLYVVDREGGPCPVGVAGEIWIGGDGLGRGYIGRADLTAERFQPDPFSREGGARVYRTGDLGRVDGEGRIRYLGRIDQQVKVRGLRIELGEIESLLNQHVAVSQSAVVVREDALAGYVVPRSDLSAWIGQAGGSEAEGEQVNQWEMVFDENYSEPEMVSGLDVDYRFDIRGWKSSYTGLPIPEAEMREWVEETVASILALSPRRVLEIGCGSGLLLWRIAPHCEQYVGTDFSERAVRNLRDHIAGSELDPVVRVEKREADDLSGITDGTYDVIVLNSVVQYFPQAEYLLRVIERALKVLSPGGRIFLGDIRNLAMLEVFATSVEAKRSSGSIGREQLRQGARKRMEQEEELVLAPEFFTSLQQRFPRIDSVEVRPKRGRFRNELTCYRYDIILHTEPNRRMDAAPVWLNWDVKEGSLNRLLAELEANKDEVVGIFGVRNARVELDNAIACWAEGSGDAEILESLQEKLAATALVASALDPADVCALGESLGREVFLSCARGSTDGSYDVLFGRQGETLEGHRYFDAAAASVSASYANDPLRARWLPRLGRELQRYLSERLPEYMVPSSYVLLERLPLSLNGKLDRRALQLLEVSAEPAVQYVAPGTVVEELLCGIWREVLGREKIGVLDGFFEAGGNSLIATQVISRARRIFRRDIPLRQIFETPTVRGLGGWIEAKLNSDKQLQESQVKALSGGDRELPLSYAQQRLWFLSELAPGSAFYNVPGGAVIRGELSVAALEQSLREVVRRHEALRTRFVVGADGPMQIVMDSIPIALDIDDLRGLDEKASDQVVRSLSEQESCRSFDLTEGPLLRARLLWKGEGEYVLLLTLHHIVSDGWSHQILVRELTELYRSFAAGTPSPLEELSIQYGDYAQWQREWMQGDVYREQLGYWKEQLAGVESLQLPADRIRPAMQSFRGGIEQSVLEPEVLSGLRELAHREGVTLYMVLLAGYVALLHRYSGQSDVVLGTPIANRNRSEIEGLIGFFVNTLVLRVKVRERMSFRELIREVREVCLGAYAHQDLPFEKLVDELQPERDLSRNPLFQVMFVMLNAPDQHLRFSQAEVHNLLLTNESAKFDLQMFLVEKDGNLVTHLEYSQDLYDQETVAQMVRHYKQLLYAAVVKPETKLGQMEMLGAHERSQLVEDWSQEQVQYENEGTFRDVLEAQASNLPDAIAVVSGHESVTYEELNKRANQLAHHLQMQGVGPEQLVAICIERSVALIVGLMGIVKTGGAYLPLDGEYPAERLRWMMKDAGATVLVTESRHASLLAEGIPGTTVISIDNLQQGVDQAYVPVDIHPENSFCVVYERELLGNPRAITLCYGTVLNTMAALHHYSATNRRVAHAIFDTFGFGLPEIFATWNCGGTVILLHWFHRSVHTSGVSTTPHEFDCMILPAALQDSVVFGLDPNEIADNYRPQLIAMGTGTQMARKVSSPLGCGEETYSFYGTTATHVSTLTSANDHKVKDVERCIIGKPLATRKAYVLDRYLEPSPVGVPGQLYLSMAENIRGYGQSTLTAERLVPDFLGSQSGSRLYGTGDLVRYRASGEFEYVGRIGNQISVRGYRFGLETLETLIRNCHSGIRDAAVNVVPSQLDIVLVCYFERKSDAILSAEDLRRKLKESIPSYMVPDSIIEIDKLPLLPSGDVDRDHLSNFYVVPQISNAQEIPETATETDLQQIFEEFLNRKNIGVTEDFFALGGHSLMAVRIVGRLQKQFGTSSISLKDFFAFPTVRGLASVLEDALLVSSDADKLSSLLALIEGAPEEQAGFSTSNFRN